jgi:2-dehydro-3-deoxyphosphogluconate aldolase/(4S)-4-hydroxy-2-oxoglutarate aldolase
MGIIRGIGIDIIDPLVETVISSGLKTIEIAMNTPNAVEVLKKTVNASAGKIFVGAGTVLDSTILEESLAVGASFIVTPTFVPGVTRYCLENDIPVFPGAITPTEILAAWNAGATMVKVFPVRFFGEEYIKDIKGPMNDILLLVCGGITSDNIAGYFKNGADAVAFAGSVFSAELIEKKDFKGISDSIKKIVGAFEKCLDSKS